MRKVRIAMMLAIAIAGAHARAQGPAGDPARETGSVRLPLARYQELLEGQAPRGGEPAYALSDVSVSVTASETEGHAGADVRVEASVRSFAEGWALVPLASGVAITDVVADGRPAELVTRGGLVAWPVEGAGTHRLAWSFHVEATRTAGGWVLSVPTPEGGGRLTASVPGADPVAVPSSGASVSTSGETSSLSATLPPTSGIAITWRSESTGGATLSRARYRGEPLGPPVGQSQSVRFVAELSAETEAARTILPLFPSSVALEELVVDNVEAPITVREGRIAVVLIGRGRHRIRATFVAPVERVDGVPHLELDLPQTPVSRFELALTGEHEVQVEPSAAVVTARRGDRTEASFHVPATEHVSIRWTEAVPEQEAEAIEIRANASLIHLVHPDEGVLTVHTRASYEITRGAISRVELEVPEGLAINTVTCAQATIGDWRVVEDGATRLLTVFLDRALERELVLEVEAERAWPARTRTSEALAVPMLRARGVSRQRGMVAIVASRELTLEPREEEHLTRVGDNALPAEIRQGIEGTVAHTWRFLDEAPRLVAIGAVRAPEPARFDAQVDTLVSLGEVSTMLAVRAEIDVKSGTLSEVRIEIPEGLSVLEVSAPSLRRHRLDERALIVELTQPMEGRFAIELTCERILGEENELVVPLVRVAGAEVERGRVGVEALAAFQVDAAGAEHLSPIDSSELPEPLLLRTDNPILHAYRYAQANEPPQLSLRITRHREVQTRQAAIDDAVYRTLYTEDGVAVTMARFFVRNRRQQFLRVSLPEGSEVWSARVDGRSQSPALEGGDDDPPTVLINIVSAAQGFEVELVYSTPVPALGTFGRLSATLPATDLVVTRTRWELYLPAGADYATPSAAMTLVEAGTPVGAAAFAEGAPEDLRLDVPAEGVRFVFQKMYAGSGGDAVRVSIPYARGWGGTLSSLASTLGALLFGLALLAFGVVRFGLPLPPSVGARLPLATYRDHKDTSAPVVMDRKLVGALAGIATAGALLMLLTLGYLKTSPWLALTTLALLGLGTLGMGVKQRLDARRAAEPAPSPPAPPSAAPEA